MTRQEKIKVLQLVEQGVKIKQAIDQCTDRLIICVVERDPESETGEKIIDIVYDPPLKPEEIETYRKKEVTEYNFIRGNDQGAEN